MATNEHNARLYRRKWYSLNAGHAKDKTRSRVKALKTWLTEKKSALKCARCPESHPATLDFHHLDPAQKDRSVAKAVIQGWSIERLEREIAKCLVLCANCHRKLHYEERLAPVSGVEPADMSFGDSATPTRSLVFSFMK